MANPHFKVQHLFSKLEKINKMEQRQNLGPYIKLVDQFIDDSFKEKNNGNLEDNFPACLS